MVVVIKLSVVVIGHFTLKTKNLLAISALLTPIFSRPLISQTLRPQLIIKSILR